jgi:hypothetical protein
VRGASTRIAYDSASSAATIQPKRSPTGRTSRVSPRRRYPRPASNAARSATSGGTNRARPVASSLAASAGARVDTPAAEGRGTKPEQLPDCQGFHLVRPFPSRTGPSELTRLSGGIDCANRRLRPHHRLIVAATRHQLVRIFAGCNDPRFVASHSALAGGDDTRPMLWPPEPCRATGETDLRDAHRRQER